MAKIKPFEDYSEEYDEWFDRNYAKYQAELRALRLIIPLNKNGLEVGVGSGKFAAPLAVKTGVDPSPKMLKKVKKLGLQVVLGVAEKLPFVTNCFDFVLMVTTICFVENLNDTFLEAYRVIKQGGFIVVGFIDKESELGKIYQQNKDKSHFYKTANFFSTQEVFVHLAKAGFENFEIKQTIFPEKNRMQQIENGFGTGSFVVIKAQKIQ